MAKKSCPTASSIMKALKRLAGEVGALNVSKIENPARAKKIHKAFMAARKIIRESRGCR